MKLLISPQKQTKKKKNKCFWDSYVTKLIKFISNTNATPVKIRVYVVLTRESTIFWTN